MPPVLSLGRATVLGALLAALLPLPLSGPSVAPAAAAAPAVLAPTSPSATDTRGSVTPTAAAAGGNVLTPRTLPWASGDLAGPLRGQYRWMGYGPQPASWPAPDVYYRDQVYWGRLEPTRRGYDLSQLDAGLADARSRRASFGFRVMAYCPGCWMETRDDLPPVVPSWMPRQPGSDIPDWNSETFLGAWEGLMSTLGSRYADDPALGYVDVGGFGAYGEWVPAGTDITRANAQRLVRAVVEAFPTQHVLLSAVPMWTQRPDVTSWAVGTFPTLGLRADCLGNPSLQYPKTEYADLWRTRPFLTEWCSNGEPLTGLRQVREHHVSTVSSGNRRLAYADMTTAQQEAYAELVARSGYRYAVERLSTSPITPGAAFDLSLTLRNDGVAPTYDPWQVRLVLHADSGARVATFTLPVDLRTVLPGTRTVSTRLVAPTLPDGLYRAAIEVRDPSGYARPMHLANAARTAAGTYPLGRLAVGESLDPVSRLDGANRYHASAAISAATFDPGVPTAYIATGATFPDALSGAPAAATENSPVLLVTRTGIPTPVATELTRLRPHRIVILGGPASVDTGVQRALAGFVAR